ncbi:MAG: molecular chaperone Tir [bacterium]
MTNYFEKVKNYLLELGYSFTHENEEQALLVITDLSHGINNLVIDCEGQSVILEQFIFELKNYDTNVLLRLLQMSRHLVQGAFVVDENGNKVLYRDTLQLENLDLNELKASIDSLVLAMAEFSNEIISFARD